MRKKELKALLTGHVKNQEARITIFAERLRRLLDKEFERAVREVAQAGTVDAAASFGRIEAKLRDIGLDVSTRMFLREQYRRELRQVKAYFDLVGKGVDFDIADATAAEALIELDLSQISTSIAKISTTLKSQLMRQVLLGEEPNVRDLADNLTGRMQANIETELRTATMAYNRTVSAEKGKAAFGDELRFYYDGPDDAITRPFCRDVLNPGDRPLPVYSEAEVAGMDNGQGLEVQIHGGGYNCRHSWNPVSADFEEFADDY